VVFPDKKMGKEGCPSPPKGEQRYREKNEEEKNGPEDTSKRTVEASRVKKKKSNLPGRSRWVVEVTPYKRGK